MWESLEGGLASVALWAVMAVGLATALFGWFLFRANRRSLGSQARARARLGYVLMIFGPFAFAGGPDLFGLFSR
jgi:hypothetical protein